MSTEANKALVSRFFEEAFSGGNIALLDELMAPDFVYHLNSDTVLHGVDAAKKAMSGVRGLFPDLHHTVEDQIAEEDRIAARYTYTGTYQGGSNVFPTTAIGKRFTAKGLIVFRVVDARFVEAWHSTDRLAHYQQLDLRLTPAQS